LFQSTAPAAKLRSVPFNDTTALSILIEYVLDSGDRAACRDGQTADFWSEGTKFDDCNMKTTGGRRAVRGTFNQD
ncbi:hypothetical protein, partial [Burkholderia sp. BDU5]|uniref:hypothetical protein n=1 Tax=Burkholderia sp. BDU5 TaxID=1385590 RepID=UPI001E38A2A1